ncbi:helix-turn-helix transcriptional regulator [Nonomuraea sp. NPDC050310]|uniref:helix-turn-helix domain-containing protein n=1 Tax=Nonomuraea sp. NPDC050310 TaxID=3154935 RepID=UPI00340A2AD2
MTRHQTSRSKRLTQDPRAITRRRIAAGLSITALAHRAGISIGFLCHIEKGEKSASAETLGKLSAALDCEITDLMAEELVG